MKVQNTFRVRSLKATDLKAVVELDDVLTGSSKRDYWKRVFADALTGSGCIALVMEGETGIEGYIFGEVRSFEFGSSECGWILALGVRPETVRMGLASALLEEARSRFKEMGVSSLRTMVRRTDVPLLSLFRSHGFVGGPFVQLEADLGEVQA